MVDWKTLVAIQIEINETREHVLTPIN